MVDFYADRVYLCYSNSTLPGIPPEPSRKSSLMQSCSNDSQYCPVTQWVVFNTCLFQGRGGWPSFLFFFNFQWVLGALCVWNIQLWPRFVFSWLNWLALCSGVRVCECDWRREGGGSKYLEFQLYYQSPHMLSVWLPWTWLPASHRMCAVGTKKEASPSSPAVASFPLHCAHLQILLVPLTEFALKLCWCL